MKKIFKRATAIVIALLLFVTGVPLQSLAVNASAENEISYKVIEDTFIDSSVAASSAKARFSFFTRTTFDGCYGNQLTDIAKELYDSMVKQLVTDKKTQGYDYTFKNPFIFDAEISGGQIVITEQVQEIANTISIAMQAAFDAFLYDHPEIFWLKNINTSYSLSASGNSVSGYKGIVDGISIILGELYSGASSKVSQYNSAVEAALDSISVTESRNDTLKAVHDYICENAYYNNIADNRVHSSEAFFIGDGGVVCEGYAKSFKVICDRLEIPCVLVSGDAGGAHMWNYVQMEDDKWYLVDVTWDDQKSGIYYTYFLANSNTIGFDDITISKERTEHNDFSGTGTFSFVYPELSSTAYVSHIHSWSSNYTVDVEATCTEKGSKSIHCLTCSATKNETEISAKGHNWTAATCTTKKTCSTCGATDGSALGHSYTSKVTTEATCTTDGIRTYTCSRCSDSYTEAVAKLGHSWSAATCTSEKTCATCGETDGSVLGHSYTSKVTTEATCTTDGVKTYTCSRCSDSYTEAIAKLGHDEVPHEAKTATCTEKGWEAYVTCSRCDYTTYKEIAAKGHTFTEKIIDSAHLVSEATTSSPAIYKYDCADCDTIGEETFTHGDKLADKLGKTAKITAIQNTSAIKLTWDKVEGADGYAVYRVVDGKWKHLGNTTSLTATIGGLSAGAKETFAVRAGKIVGGKVAWADTFTTINTATKAVKPATVSAIQNTSAIRLTWTASKGATGYRIYYKSGNSWNVCLSTTSLTTHTFYNLKAGAKFTFAIRPYILIDGNVIWSDYITYTTSTTPAAVTAKAASSASGRVALTWNAVSGADGYQVYYKVGNGGYQLYKTYGSVQTLNFSGLKSGTQYTFAVRAGIKTSGGNIFGSYKTAAVTVK